MTALNRPFIKPAPALALAAALSVAASVASVGAPAQAQQPNPACSQALAYEKTAANDSSTRQAAYDAAAAGLAVNQRCNDAQMKLVNEAYLLSMRAAAEQELKVGNWQRDMTRANMLLTQCANWPGLKNTRAGTDCDTQRRYNDIMAKKLATPPSTPRPATPAPAMASPGPGTTGAARPTPVPLPTPPSPNRPPR
ncbi:MAG TPA: hypothetical protein VK669_15510 [Candidatus Limnocylindrales bacterium]|nr:hypothetical protein [Candidatus Limnocylindrales bacterium]